MTLTPPLPFPSPFPFPFLSFPPPLDGLVELMLPDDGPAFSVVHNLGLSAGCGPFTALMLLNALTSVSSLGNLRSTLYIEGSTEIALSPVYFLIITLAEAGIGKSFWLSFFLTNPVEKNIQRELLAFYELHADAIAEKIGKAANVKSFSLMLDNGTTAAYTAYGGVNAATLHSYRESADVQASAETLEPTAVDVVLKALTRLHVDHDLHDRPGKVPAVTITTSDGETSTLTFGVDGDILEEDGEGESLLTSSPVPGLIGNIDPPAMLINICNAESAVAFEAEGTYKMGPGGVPQANLTAQAFICAAATGELGSSGRAGEGGSGRNATGGVGSSLIQVTATNPGTFWLFGSTQPLINGYWERVIVVAPIVKGTVSE